MVVYVSETEIHGTTGWPDENSVDPYNGTVVHAITPTVLKPIDDDGNGKNPYILSNGNTLQYISLTHENDRPLMEHEADFGKGQYVRVYMRRLDNYYVGGTLLAFFGSPLS